MGRRASTQLLIFLALAVGGGIAYLAFTRRLAWGVLAVVPVTFLVPLTVGTGTNIALNATLLFVTFLFAVWLLRMLVLEKDLRLVPSRLNLPVILFILATTLSLLFGNSPLVLHATERASLPAQLGGWSLYVLSVGMVLLVGNAVRDIRWLRILTWTFLGFGAGYTAIVLAYGKIKVTEAFFKDGISTSIFWSLLAALSFGQLLFNRDLTYKSRVVLGLITLSGLYFGWVGGKEWIAGWLPPLIAIYLLLCLRSWKVGLLATVVAGILFYFYYFVFSTQVNTSEQQWSTLTRIVTWPIMFDLIKTSPIFGLGPANYRYYTHLYNYFGYFLKFNSHNNYLDIAAQTGLLGLGLFAWLVLELGKLGWRVRKKVEDGFSRAYVNSMLAFLGAMLAAGVMADWFLPFLYNIGIPGFRTSIFAWLFLGGLISLEGISRNSSIEKQQENGA